MPNSRLHTQQYNGNDCIGVAHTFQIMEDYFESVNDSRELDERHEPPIESSAGDVVRTQGPDDDIDDELLVDHDEEQPLLPVVPPGRENAANQVPPRRYPDIQVVNQMDDIGEVLGGMEFHGDMLEGNFILEPTKRYGCCGGRCLMVDWRGIDCVQLWLYLLTLLLALAMATFLVQAKFDGHNQCFPHVSLDPTRVYMERSVTTIGCYVGIYYCLLSGTLAYTVIVIKWLAQLTDSRRWLLGEVVLNILMIICTASVCSTLTTSYMVWCDEIMDTSVCLPPHSCPAGWQNVSTCMDAVMFIQSHYDFDLLHLFVYIVISMGLCGLSLVIWVGSLGAAHRRYYSTCLRMTLQTQRPEVDDFIPPPEGENHDQQDDFIQEGCEGPRNEYRQHLLD